MSNSFYDLINIKLSLLTALFIRLTFNNKKMYKKILSFILGLLLFSCNPKIIVPITETKKETSEKQEAKIVNVNTVGKDLYENNCAKCHSLYEKSEFSKEDWKSILVDMQKKAHISDSEREEIYKYITTL